MTAHWVAAAPTTRLIDYWDMRTGVRSNSTVRVTRAAHLARPDGRTVCGRRVDAAAAPVHATANDVDRCWRCTTIGPDALTHRDMCEGAGITYRQLDHWVRRGWLHPHGGTRHGSGNQRTFPLDELAAARRMGELTRSGVTASVAAEVARHGDLALAWSVGRGECA